jgi:hypothetical protein
MPAAADNVLLRVRDCFINGLLPGSVWSLVPRGHDVFVSAEDERALIFGSQLVMFSSQIARQAAT